MNSKVSYSAMGKNTSGKAKGKLLACTVLCKSFISE